MLWCLNPDCSNPQNSDGTKFCQNCGTQLVPLLRGHYRILSLLSDEGGFGRTYLAEDIDKLNQKCVVKQLAPKVQGTWALKKAVELFEQEAHRLQQLGEHPQIPQLHAYFEQDNNLYLVQEFIDGQNLSNELQQFGATSYVQVRELLLDLLPVLKFVHEHDVIHRDIKPPNIMRRQSDRRLILIDFGASKQFTATVQAKQGTMIGSHGYVPMEQMQGGEAYAASDLFSLGATCFHLLSGISPNQLWMKQGYGWTTDWQQYLQHPATSTADKQLVTVLDKLLQVEHQQRYQSANDVIQALQVPPIIKSPVPTTLISPPSIDSNIPLAPVKQKQQWVIGAVAALLGLGGIWYFQSQHKVTTTISDTPVATPTAQNVSQNYLVKSLKNHSSAVNTVAISSDGTMLASGSGDKTVKLWNLSNNQEMHTLAKHSDLVWSVAFSPDNKILASSSRDQKIILWDVATAKSIRTLEGHTEGVPSVAISKDGKYVVSGSRDNTVKIWDILTGKQLRSLTQHTDVVNSVAVSPDNQTIASGSSDKTIKLWNINTGTLISTLSGHTGQIVSVAFSTDGKMLASAGVDKTVKLWDIATGEIIHTFSGHNNYVVSVAFSPDGKTLASGSFDSTIKLWDLATKQETRLLAEGSGYVNSLTFNPDGRTLVSGRADTSVNIWRMVN